MKDFKQTHGIDSRQLSAMSRMGKISTGTSLDNASQDHCNLGKIFFAYFMEIMPAAEIIATTESEASDNASDVLSNMAEIVKLKGKKRKAFEDSTSQMHRLTELLLNKRQPKSDLEEKLLKEAQPIIDSFWSLLASYEEERLQKRPPLLEFEN